MSKRGVTSPPPKPPLALTEPKVTTAKRLADRIEKGQELKLRAPFSPNMHGTEEALSDFKKDVLKWHDYNKQLLRSSFTSDTIEAEYASHLRRPITIRHQTPPLGDRWKSEIAYLDRAIHKLESIAERLEIIPEAPPAFPDSTLVTQTQPASLATKKVFIVHGHDDVAKMDLEAMLREWGLDPIILHRQADQGKTIIEKFETHSDVGYAFILLTPDEVAYLATDEKLPDHERRKERRARPNVIWEFGYFTGKLGRNRVCCLHTGNVSLPSDVSGIIYKPYLHRVEEAGVGIMRELKASGILRG